MRFFVICAMMIQTALPVQAAGGAAQDCGVTAAIVAGAAARRAQGLGPSDAAASLAAGELDPRFVPAIQPLVAWVYTLPPDQLTEAPGAFEAACLKQAD